MTDSGRSAATSKDEPVPKPGDRIGGRYVAEAILGRGASSVVMTAHHPDLGRPVAIKILRSWVALPQAKDRIVREARALTSMQSEHVVRVMDVAIHEGAPFIVMELLDGSDLAAVLQERGPLPVEEVVDCVLQASDAIAEAHARGIIHRDLKPSNLFLTKRVDASPLVKVLDFGIAKTPAELGEGLELSLTDSAAVLGSPMYMSPEQVRSSKHVDHRTDIWSLGVIMYRLLTGVAPFAGDTFSSVCASIVADLPVPLPERRADVPEELWRVVQRCMEKEPAWRFTSVLELVRALAPFASDRGRASIQRLLRASPVTAAPEAVELPPPPKPQVAPMESTMGTVDLDVPYGKPTQSRMGRTLAWAGIAAAVVLGVALWPRDRSATSVRSSGREADALVPAATGAPAWAFSDAAVAIIDAAPPRSEARSSVSVPPSATTPRKAPRPPAVGPLPSATGEPINRALDERR